MDNFFAAMDFFRREKALFLLTQKRINGKVGDSLQSEKVVPWTVFDNQAASNWQLAISRTKRF
jgi:hypothetical protein